jgi:peptidoglycan/xylan/chitin deacetylase (PgdA/CDA1 family)
LVFALPDNGQMIGPITLKDTVKQTAGWAALLSRLFTEPSSRRACIFYYHRIVEVGFRDSRIDDWNVTPQQFERQIAALTSFAEIIPLIDLPSRLQSSARSSRPFVCLTFDDGYANFHSQVLPILRRYKVPATAFVVTSQIGSPQPMPFDRWAHKNHARINKESWRPLSWHELEDCVSSGLVTIGAHSHRHLRGSQCTADQIAEEAERSREILRIRLGKAHSVQYAYPYGNSKLGDVSSDYKCAVRAAGYELAVTTDLGLVHAQNDLYSLPRLEAHTLDSPGVLKAKAAGALGPYRLTDHFRAAYRA